jgi:hypothetical protein
MVNKFNYKHYWQADCWDCGKILDVYLNDWGNDGSTGVLCKDCFDKGNKA